MMYLILHDARLEVSMLGKLTEVTNEKALLGAEPCSQPRNDHIGEGDGSVSSGLPMDKLPVWISRQQRGQESSYTDTKGISVLRSGRQN